MSNSKKKNRFIYKIKTGFTILTLSFFFGNSLPVRSAEFKLPYDADVFIKTLDGEASASSSFGLGTTSQNFISFLSGLPNNPSTTEEVFLGNFLEGETIPFAIETEFRESSFFATISGTDQGSIVAFTDINNNLGFGGDIFQQIDHNIFIGNFDDAASFLVDDDDTDIVVQIRLDEGSIVPEPTIIYKIKALIDGSDTLIINDNTLQWQHHNFAAVGRHEGRNEPTTISAILNGQTILEEIEWIPTWPEPVPNEIRFPSLSSIFTELNPSFPNIDTIINVNPIISRGSTTIEQFPSKNNEFTLKIFYDDDRIPGSTFYETEILVNLPAGSEPENIPEPHSIFGLFTILGLSVLNTTRKLLSSRCHITLF